MTITIKNQNNKTPLVVPLAMRRKAGFKSGEELEFKASCGIITILPKLPRADEEYTAEQRGRIDAQLAEGLADIEASRTHGPFDSADEMVRDIKARVKQKKAAQREPAAPKAKRLR